MAEKLNPEAFADFGEGQEGTQDVTADMIYTWVIEQNELPPESAKPFAAWLDEAWLDFEKEGKTVGQVVNGALSAWCGGRTK